MSLPNNAKQHIAFKRLFKVVFNEFISSKLFNTLINILDGTKFKYETLESHHRNEVIDFVSKTWSYKHVGNKSAWTIFEVDEIDLHVFVDDEIDSAIKVGGGIIIKNQLGKIIAFTYLIDCCNGYFTPATPITSSNISISCVHGNEIYCSVKNDFIHQLRKQNNGEFKYGVYAHCGLLTVHPKYRKCGLSLLIHCILDYLCVKLRYKHIISLSTNLLTANPPFPVCDIKTKKYDFSSWIFKDGTKMKHYFDKAKQIQFKGACQLTTIHGRYENITDKIMESKMITKALQYTENQKLKSKL
eukprot:479208_1